MTKQKFKKDKKKSSFVIQLKKVKATFIKSIRTSNTRKYFKMNNKQCEVGKDI
jgi:hypothetical protein